MRCVWRIAFLLYDPCIEVCVRYRISPRDSVFISRVFVYRCVSRFAKSTRDGCFIVVSLPSVIPEKAGIRMTMLLFDYFA